MDKKKKSQIPDSVVAPGIDEEDAYGEMATKSEIKNGESTTVRGWFMMNMMQAKNNC